MSKPYETELSQLPQTYRWALKADVDRLIAAVQRAALMPLVAVGSGGSFSVAEFAASLHRNLSQRPALAQTPLDVVGNEMNFRRAAVMMTSAGGANPDALGSFEALAAREPANLTVICLSAGTPLARRASRFPFVDFIELPAPVARDGFLATNSLLALLVVLTRAYAAACGTAVGLPDEWRQIVSPRNAAKLGCNLRPAWDKKTLVVLHGSSTRVAAVDLESRFTEAALQDVWIADYRNFAHGRHHWLAKRPDTTAVLALITPDDRELASKTLALIPHEVMVIREEVPFSGVTAGIAALARVLHVAASAGQARGIDPGRPGVPVFGRRIYHLNAFQRTRVSPTAEETAIERKTDSRIKTLSVLGVLDYWRDAYRTFMSEIQSATFRGVVVDYDGTLCGEAERFGKLQPGILNELARIARAGCPVGIATGRGKSVWEALRGGLPQSYWNLVAIGYYNGGDIRLLSEEQA